MCDICLSFRETKFHLRTRQFPNPIQFDATIPLHRQFVVYGTLLRLRAFGINDIDISIVEEEMKKLIDFSFNQEPHTSFDNPELLFPTEFEKVYFHEAFCFTYPLMRQFLFLYYAGRFVIGSCTVCRCSSEFKVGNY